MVETFCITPDASILDAMKKIDEAAIATVMVCEGQKVCGVLTDGDLRRAIIKGADLSDSIKPIYTRDFISVPPDALRRDVLALMNAHFIEQVPVVNVAGELEGVHTLHSLLGNRVKPNCAVIMAGGKGTRLGKLTEYTPKPMLKVAGRPILEHLVLHLMSFGIRKIYIAVNHLSEVIEDYFKDGSELGCSIEYLREDEPLGSGGALSLLPESQEHPMVVLNGDVILEADITQMLLSHDRDENYATIGVHHYSHEVPFGCLSIEQNEVVELREKPIITESVNTGVYVLSPQAVSDVPQRTFFPITQLFEWALRDGKRCGAYHLDGDWMDLGMPDQLKQARGIE